MTFESFYKELISDSLWWDTCQVNHSGKDFKKAMRDVHADFIARGVIPEMKEARRYVYNKLNYMPQKVETNYQTEKPPDTHLNPLTDEERQRVDKLLNEFKSSLKVTKKAPDLDKETIEKEGQVRPKRVDFYPSYPKELLANDLLRIEWIRECHNIYTGEPNENYIDFETWKELRK